VFSFFFTLNSLELNTDQGFKVLRIKTR